MILPSKLILRKFSDWAKGSSSGQRLPNVVEAKTNGPSEVPVFDGRVLMTRLITVETPHSQMFVRSQWFIPTKASELAGEVRRARAALSPLAGRSELNRKRCVLQLVLSGGVR